MTTAPTGLASGGSALWADITGSHELDAIQRVQLLEACRAKDRLDRLDAVIRAGDKSWSEQSGFTLSVDRPADLANAAAQTLKRLISALRLANPKTGHRPQRRGGARGVYRSRGTR